MFIAAMWLLIGSFIMAQIIQWRDFYTDHEPIKKQLADFMKLWCALIVLEAFVISLTFVLSYAVLMWLDKI